MISNNSHQRQANGREFNANISERDNDARIQSHLRSDAKVDRKDMDHAGNKVDTYQADRINERLNTEEERDRTPQNKAETGKDKDWDKKREEFMKEYGPVSNINKAPYDDRHEKEDLKVIDYQSRRHQNFNASSSANTEQRLAETSKMGNAPENETENKKEAKDTTEKKSNLREKRKNNQKQEEERENQVENPPLKREDEFDQANYEDEFESKVWERQAYISSKREKELEAKLMKQDRELNENIKNFTSTEAKRDHLMEMEHSTDLSSYHNATDPHKDVDQPKGAFIKNTEAFVPLDQQDISKTRFHMPESSENTFSAGEIRDRQLAKERYEKELKELDATRNLEKTSDARFQPTDARI